MSNELVGVEELSELIVRGKAFVVSGAEELLLRLPRGNWIGGTSPYFMTNSGGLISKDKVFATEIPETADRVVIRMYDEESIGSVYQDAPNNGFSFIILPSGSRVHLNFALNAPWFQSFAVSPLVGWVSGVHLDDLGRVTPKVINGQTGELTDKQAAVMQVGFEKGYMCELGIMNIFKQGSGDTLEFPDTRFSAKDVLVNGVRTNFADYTMEKGIDTRLPLVANYAGAMINISFQNINLDTKTVDFYAPVFKGVQYKQALAVDDYFAEYSARIPSSANTLFSCSCILNFLYSNLEGREKVGFAGPVTFGEVAYQLLNQTMVYLNITR